MKSLSLSAPHTEQVVKKVEIYTAQSPPNTSDIKARPTNPACQKGNST